MTDFTLGDTLDIKFSTRSFSTGAPTTLAGTPVISAYPDNSTTQLTAGITLTVDFDSVTGLHNVRVVATSGNGYASGTSYSLVITTGTVGGVSVVGEVIGEFTLGRSAAAADLANGTDGLTALASTLSTIAGYIDTEVAAIKAVTDALPNSGALTSLATAAALATAQSDLDTLTGSDGATVSSASLAAIVDAVWDEDIVAAHTTADTAGNKLAAAGGAADPWATSVPGAYGAGTAGNIIGNLSVPTAAAIRAEIDSNSTQLAAIVADTNELQTDDVPGLIAALNDPTAATVAAAVWDAVQSSHVTAGSFGEIATEIASILADTNELQTDDYPTALTALQSDVTSILADTNELQSDDYPTTLATLATAASIAALNDLDAAGIRTAIGMASADLDTQLAALPTAAEVRAEIDSNSTKLATLSLGIITGAAATGTLSTTQATSNLSGYADDQLIGRIIIWTSGACEGEATDITDYANTSGLLTFTALTTAPGNGDTFKIV